LGSCFISTKLCGADYIGSIVVKCAESIKTVELIINDRSVIFDTCNDNIATGNDYQHINTGNMRVSYKTTDIYRINSNYIELRVKIFKGGGSIQCVHPIYFISMIVDWDITNRDMNTMIHVQDMLYPKHLNIQSMIELENKLASRRYVDYSQHDISQALYDTSLLYKDVCKYISNFVSDNTMQFKVYNSPMNISDDTYAYIAVHDISKIEEIIISSGPNIISKIPRIWFEYHAFVGQKPFIMIPLNSTYAYRIECSGSVSIPIYCKSSLLSPQSTFVPCINYTNESDCITFTNEILCKVFILAQNKTTREISFDALCSKMTLKCNNMRVAEWCPSSSESLIFSRVPQVPQILLTETPWSVWEFDQMVYFTPMCMGRIDKAELFIEWLDTTTNNDIFVIIESMKI